MANLVMKSARSCSITMHLQRRENLAMNSLKSVLESGDPKMQPRSTCNRDVKSVTKRKLKKKRIKEFKPLKLKSSLSRHKTTYSFSRNMTQPGSLKTSKNPSPSTSFLKESAQEEAKLPQILQSKEVFSEDFLRACQTDLLSLLTARKPSFNYKEI